jgi:hypothetical protein
MHNQLLQEESRALFVVIDKEMLAIGRMYSGWYDSSRVAFEQERTYLVGVRKYLLKEYSAGLLRVHLAQCS